MFRICPDASWKALEGLKSRSSLGTGIRQQRGEERKELGLTAGKEGAALTHPNSTGGRLPYKVEEHLLIKRRNTGR